MSPRAKSLYSAADAKGRQRQPPRETIERTNPFAPNHDAQGQRPLRPGPTTSEPSPEDQRQPLLALRSRLRGDVVKPADSTLAGSAEITSASPDAADQASAIVDQDLAVSLLATTTDTLDQIEAALARIDNGSYGRCQECGKNIPAARLEAVPHAACCVTCAARQERRQASR